MDTNEQPDSGLAIADLCLVGSETLFGNLTQNGAWMAFLEMLVRDDLDMDILVSRGFPRLLAELVCELKPLIHERCTIRIDVTTKAPFYHVSYGGL